MGGGDEGLQVRGGSVVGVDGVDVFGPVAVVAAGGVYAVLVGLWEMETGGGGITFDNGGDPDGVEAETFDVVEIVLHSLPGTTAVVGEVAAGGGAGGGFGESIGEHL